MIGSQLVYYLYLYKLFCYCNFPVFSTRWSEAQLKIETTTSFVNYVGEVLHQPGEYQIFKAPTCKNYDSGYNVKVKVYNPHNPQHNPNLGITYFSVSNKLYNGVRTPHKSLFVPYPYIFMYITAYKV